MTKQIRLMKDTMKLGVGSMAGMGVMGAMNSMPGMPANQVSGTVGTSLNMLNIGQMSKNAMSVFPNTTRRRRR